jgi:phycocyanin-associated rod protein
MFGQVALGSGTLDGAANRVFRFEVEGLRQNQEADKQGFAIRRSGTVTITVPYGRMNEEMRRIGRLGGRIVNITQLKVGE